MINSYKFTSDTWGHPILRQLPAEIVNSLWLAHNLPRLLLRSAYKDVVIDHFLCVEQSFGIVKQNGGPNFNGLLRLDILPMNTTDNGDRTVGRTHSQAKVYHHAYL